LPLLIENSNYPNLLSLVLRWLNNGCLFARLWIAVSALAIFSSTCPPSLCHRQAPPSNEIELQIIVVPSLAQAQQVLERLNRGEDFAGVAREVSTDPTASSDGFMGKLDPGTLRLELRNALQGVGPGQISQIVHIPSGYAILKVAQQESGGANYMGSGGPNLALSAAGNIRYVLDVGGIMEVESILSQYPKPPAWDQDPLMICSMRKESISSVLHRMDEIFSPDNRATLSRFSPLDLMQAHHGLGQIYAYQGRMVPAIDEYQKAYEIAKATVPAAIPQMEETLGMAFLHQSEMENEVYLSPGDRCLFPPSLASPYLKTDSSKRAVEHLLKFLELNPGDLEGRWVLNLAYMTLGKYPDGVPEKYRVSPSLFKSREDIGRFPDVAAKVGLNSFSLAGGVIVDDFENNGLLDVVTSSMDSCGAMHYFHNNGDGTFSDATAKAGLTNQLGGLSLNQTDYNNDGCMDILVMRGGWEIPQRKSLLRNNCDGTFTDVTKESGLSLPSTSTQATAWVDINNDGLLDLFIGNENAPAQLFLNKGDGTFEDISASAGVNRTAYSKGVAAADYDGDGYVDLYVSNANGENFLYHNNHDNTFTEVAEKAGVSNPGRSFSTWFFDYDNDGWPDLFVASFYASVDETVRTYLDLPHNARTLKLYRNMADGTFRDVTKEVGLDKVFMAMGANFGDVDNDGFLDIYLGTGTPSYGSLAPNVLLRNHDGKYFVDITSSSGTGELHKGHGIAFADVFNRGFEDIVAEVGGATLGDAHALRLFQNPGNHNDWINIKLVGVKTNRAGIGARIKVTVKNPDHDTRSIYRTVSSGGSFGASPLQQHIGLSKSASKLSIEVFWPVSKTRQRFSNVEKNQFIEIREFAQTYTKLDRKPLLKSAARSNTANLHKQAEKDPAKSN
jgi:tetratricopeptide (TPR) repeat protein